MTGILNPPKLECDTCHKEFERLYRVVLRSKYNALLKPTLWNCKECYDNKNRNRVEKV